MRAAGRLVLRRRATSRAHRNLEMRSGGGLARPLLAAALKARRRGGPSPGTAVTRSGRGGYRSTSRAGIARNARMPAAASPTPASLAGKLCSSPRQARMPAGDFREELAAAVTSPDAHRPAQQNGPSGHRPGRRRHRRDHAVPAHACGPARACGRWVRPRHRGRDPGTVAIRLAPVSRSCTCASTGSPWSAFHGGYRPGRCRQPGEPGFPPACASAAATSCIPGCTPRTGRPGITDRALPPDPQVTPAMASPIGHD